MYDYLNQCITKESFHTAKEQMDAIYNEAKYLGNSAIYDVLAGNYNIRPAKDIYAPSSDAIYGNTSDVKPKSKFKQFLSKIGNSFKNFFSIKEKH